MTSHNGAASDTFTLLPLQQRRTRRPQLVLIGGGHAHLIVLRALHEHKHNDLFDVVLISENCKSYYSGMIPGFVAGLYKQSDVSIDLAPVVTYAAATFIERRVVGVDVVRKLIFAMNVSSGEIKEIEFDVLSFDIGSKTLIHDNSVVDEVKAHAIMTRPLDELLSKLCAMEEKIDISTMRPLHGVVVGSGKAGIELAFALRSRWSWRFPGRETVITILGSTKRILLEDSIIVSDVVSEILHQKDIHVITNALVTRVNSISVYYYRKDHRNNFEENLVYDLVLWATGAAAHSFIRDSTELAVSSKGFLQVDRTLRSISHPYVFGAGDCISIINFNVPKAGVFAVREGPILAHNLIASITSICNSHGHIAFKKYTPQHDFLTLIGTGDEHAIGIKFGIAFHGHWAWRLKDYIDHSFMKLFCKTFLNGEIVEDIIEISDSDRDCDESNTSPESAALLLSVHSKDECSSFGRQNGILKRMSSEQDFADAVVNAFCTKKNIEHAI